MSAILNRSREKLAAGEVTLPIAINEYPVSNGERQIRTFSLNVYPFMPHKPIHQPLLLCGNLFPACNRISIVEEAHIKHKLLKFAQ